MGKNGRGSEDRRVALVIGSGAVKCAAALDLWKVLSREGIHIDLFVGCSGGSLFAATMALGFEVEECIDKTRRLWNREITGKRHWSSMLRAILPGFRFDERFGARSYRWGG
jgi:NTE family protein